MTQPDPSALGASPLDPLRQRIDEIDDRIVELLAQRQEVVREVAAVKRQHGIPVRLPDRIEAVKARNAGRGAMVGLNPDLVRRVYDLLIEEACRTEEQLIDERPEIERKPGPG